MITRFYKKKLVFFLILSIIISNVIFSCKQNIHSKKNNYVCAAPAIQSNYSNCINEIKNILYQTNYLKDVINQNNYILGYYKKIFSSNINYVCKKSSRIKKKIHIANTSIIHELNKIYNIKNIIMNHPYNYSFFLKMDNYYLPNIHNNSNSKKIQKKLTNIETFTNSLNKKKISINNISYKSEESFIGIKNMFSTLSTVKSLVISKIYVNYDNIYYFSKLYNNLIPINNYSSSSYKNIISDNQFVNNTNIKVKIINKQPSLFKKQNIYSYVTNKRYVIILPFLFVAGVLILILGGTKNTNRKNAKKNQWKIDFIKKSKISAKKNDKFWDEKKVKTSIGHNSDEPVKDYLKATDNPEDYYELMEIMPSYLEEPQPIDKPDIFLETSLDDVDFYKTGHSNEEWRNKSMTSEVYKKTHRSDEHSKAMSTDETTSDKKSGLEEGTEGVTDYNTGQIARYGNLSNSQTLIAPISIKSGPQILMYKRDIAFHENILKMLTLQAQKHNIKNLLVDKWAILDDTVMLEIAQNESFFKNLHYGRNYIGIKKIRFTRQILNYLFQKRISLLETTTTYNRADWLLNIKNIMEMRNNIINPYSENHEIKHILWNIFSDKEQSKYSGITRLTTNGWFVKPGIGFLYGMRNDISTKQEYEFMVQQLKQLREMQNYIPKLHKPAEYYITLMNEFSLEGAGLIQIQNISSSDKFSINGVFCDLNELIEEYISYIDFSNIKVEELSDSPDIKVQLSDFVNKFKDTCILKENAFDLKRFKLSEEKVFDEVMKVVKK